MITLILGGIRSGKSRLAETIAERSELPVAYIATATPGDKEMHRRIAAHRARRPSTWTTLEEPICLAARLAELASAEGCVIVDCLTLWLTNLLGEDSATLVRERNALLALLPTLRIDLILVSNETNLGIIPTGDLARRFCDEAGSLHRALAEQCNRVVLTVAGLPMILKGPSL